MRKRKTWREKLADSKGLPKVVQITPDKVARWGHASMLVPAPSKVDDLMKQVPEGRVTTMNEICGALAKRHSADHCCPLTSGIFAWIAAHAAEEAAQEAGRPATPYWRTLKADGLVNPKYPGGAEHAAELLKREGHTLEQRGTKIFVRSYNNQPFHFS